MRLLETTCYRVYVSPALGASGGVEREQLVRRAAITGRPLQHQVHVPSTGG